MALAPVMVVVVVSYAHVGVLRTSFVLVAHGESNCWNHESLPLVDLKRAGVERDTICWGTAEWVTHLALSEDDASTAVAGVASVDTGVVLTETRRRMTACPVVTGRERLRKDPGKTAAVFDRGSNGGCRALDQTEEIMARFRLGPALSDKEVRAGKWGCERG